MKVDWQRLTKTLVGLLVVGAIGFFLDFRSTKASTNAKLEQLETRQKSSEKKEKLFEKMLCLITQKVDPKKAPEECLKLGRGD